MKKLLPVLLILSPIILMIWTCQPSTPAEQLHSGKITVVKNGSRGYGKMLMESLEYLNDVEEIVWVEIDENDVYIGFAPVPDDWDLIIRGAAYNGNREINFGTHVWAAYGERKGWRPGQSTYLGEVTARYGKVE